MELAEQVIHAHGGADRWLGMSRFSAHVSISGELLPSPEGRPPLGVPHVEVGGYHLVTTPRSRPTLREFVMEGETRRPFAKLFGSTDMTRYGVYSPQRAEFRHMSGALISALDAPMATLAQRGENAPLEALDRLFLFSALMWGAVVGAFVLMLGGESREEPGANDRRLQRRMWITLPKTLDPIVTERCLSIDNRGLIQHVEHALLPYHQGPIVETLSTYQCFGGIKVPTLRRMQALRPDGSLHPTPLIDIEIFDVKFFS
jgi:hypothetical protein